jgi:hypothetical protein
MEGRGSSLGIRRLVVDGTKEEGSRWKGWGEC